MRFQFLVSWRFWAFVFLPVAGHLPLFYFNLARNFLHFGSWTFDSGVSVTSGFHLGNAYLLAALAALLQPDANSFINLGLGLSIAWTVAVMGVGWYIGSKLKSAVYFLTL